MRSHLETNKITILWVLKSLVWSPTQLWQIEPISYLSITYNRTKLDDDSSTLADEDVWGVGQNSPENGFVVKVEILQGQFIHRSWG